MTWESGTFSAYHRGMMGGSTPNIDRQHPFRVSLLKVGLPGAKQGLQDKDPTIAELLKARGYATAQIGKNHLGDRNEYLPTVHGFDEFYGNLYHLNSELDFAHFFDLSLTSSARPENSFFCDHVECLVERKNSASERTCWRPLSFP